MRINIKVKIIKIVISNSILLEFKLITFLVHNASFIVCPMKPLEMNRVAKFDDKLWIRDTS